MRIIYSFLFIILSMPFMVQSQLIDFDKINTEKDPITIEADHGIEWFKDKKYYKALGNVVVVQGSTITIKADDIELHYDEIDNEQTKKEYTIMKAKNNVTIMYENSIITGQEGYWDFKKEEFFIRGKNTSYKNPILSLTAKKTLTFWQKDNKSKAVGDVKIINQQRTIHAEEVDMFFDNNNNIQQLIAKKNVKIINPNEVIHAQDVDYNIATDNAVICGNVVVKQTSQIVKGDCAYMVISTGESTIKAKQGNRVKIRID